jgi:hypothetical protein
MMGDPITLERVRQNIYTEVDTYIGNDSVLQQIKDNKIPISCTEKDCVEKATREEYLKVLQWIRENGCPWHEKTCAEAAKRENL